MSRKMMRAFSFFLLSSASVVAVTLLVVVVLLPGAFAAELPSTRHADCWSYEPTSPCGPSQWHSLLHEKDQNTEGDNAQQNTEIQTFELPNERCALGPYHSPIDLFDSNIHFEICGEGPDAHLESSAAQPSYRRASVVGPVPGTLIERDALIDWNYERQRLHWNRAALEVIPLGPLEGPGIIDSSFSRLHGHRTTYSDRHQLLLRPNALVTIPRLDALRQPQDLDHRQRRLLELMYLTVHSPSEHRIAGGTFDAELQFHFRDHDYDHVRSGKVSAEDERPLSELTQMEATYAFDAKDMTEAEEDSKELIVSIFASTSGALTGGGLSDNSIIDAIFGLRTVEHNNTLSRREGIHLKTTMNGTAQSYVLERTAQPTAASCVELQTASPEQSSVTAAPQEGSTDSGSSTPDPQQNVVEKTPEMLLCERFHEEELDWATPRPVSLAELLPTARRRDYFYYIGSESEPPCRQGIHRVVFRHPISISTRQLKTLREDLLQMFDVDYRTQESPLHQNLSSSPPTTTARSTAQVRYHDNSRTPSSWSDGTCVRVFRDGDATPFTASKGALLRATMNALATTGLAWTTISDAEDAYAGAALAISLCCLVISVWYLLWVLWTRVGRGVAVSIFGGSATTASSQRMQGSRSVMYHSESWSEGHEGESYHSQHSQHSHSQHSAAGGTAN